MKHWIGREVKRFLAEAHLHIPFLLQIAAAPADCVAAIAALVNGEPPSPAVTHHILVTECLLLITYYLHTYYLLLTLHTDEGEQCMDTTPDEDDPYAPTEAEIEQEELEEPIMLQNAAAWDNFLNLIGVLQEAWPQGEGDSDAYREDRAFRTFKLGATIATDCARYQQPHTLYHHHFYPTTLTFVGSICARDLLRLKPSMKTWVPHILCFIVPRQMLLLGDPARLVTRTYSTSTHLLTLTYLLTYLLTHSLRRSADACESLGALCKKIIKHLTCRRRITEAGTSAGQPSPEQSSQRRWGKIFTVGYVEQAFKRLCVRESLQHGADNAPFMQRVDARRKRAGVNKGARNALVKPKKAKVDAPPMHTLCQVDWIEGVVSSLEEAGKNKRVVADEPPPERMDTIG